MTNTVLDAAYMTAHDYPGGARALADGVITKLELRKIRTELTKLIAVAGKLEGIAAAMEATASASPHRRARP